MLIDDIMGKIWEKNYTQYKKIYDDAIETDTNKLFEILSEQKMGIINYPGVTMNLLATSGCPHRFREDRMSGCSMCNYQSNFLSSNAAMAALREKDINLYAKAVRLSFENARGVMSKANAFELISANDTLNQKEFPTEAFEELFSKNDLFVRKPYKYIMETRASSVTKESIEILKKYIGEKSRVLIEFGIEAGDEWVRNHWINKNITDEEIKTAIALIHEAGFKVSVDIIIGIPGLTEQQSIDIFRQTVDWADKLLADEIICLPLNRKEGTIQGFLYSELKDNQKLSEVGLVNGEHTGLPWLFSVLDAVFYVAKESPHAIDKLNFAQLSTSQNLIENTMSYNKELGCSCSQLIIEALERFRRDKNVNALGEVREIIKNDSCYGEYTDLLEKQKGAGDIPATINLIIGEVAKKLWPESWEEKISSFEKELALYKGNNKKNIWRD